MIDLRSKELPNAIQGADGVIYRIDTSFRTWIEFDRALRQEGVRSDCVLVNKDVTNDSWQDAAVMFLLNPNSTPNYPQSDQSVRSIDYIQDGEYIYASFMAAYGIDLTAVDDMHWWKFKALLQGLPKETKMSEIIGYRTYKHTSKKPEQLYQEERRAWTLPVDEEAVQEARDVAAMLWERQNGGLDG